jgi:holo-[acyl-carrier protein] synthase
MNVVGIGTDIVECLRIAQMIERHGELFLRRVYTTREIEYCSARKAATQHYAGRWAAKEAWRAGQPCRWPAAPARPANDLALHGC